MAKFIDVHALHTLPPNNINRDDTGSPKTATFGGVVRQRVSSQAWKKAIRNDFASHLAPEQLSVRTRRVVERVVNRIHELDPSWSRETAAQAVEGIFAAAKVKIAPPKSKELQEDGRLGEARYLMFLGNQQVSRMAEYIIANKGAKPTKKDVAPLLDEEHSVDIAMFGRMIADAPDFNVDAAVQVAHAIGVAGAEAEFDYFTAVDDVVAEAEETGAGMIGTVQMMSSTLYRYATIDLQSLEKNLGSGEASTAAVKAFLRAFATSMPTGKQNTFANRTLPEAIVVCLRSDRPVSWVNAFESPVTDTAGQSRRELAAHKLAAEASSLQAAYDAPADRTWVVALDDVAEALAPLGNRVNLSELLEQVGIELSVGATA